MDEQKSKTLSLLLEGYNISNIQGYLDESIIIRTKPTDGNQTITYRGILKNYKEAHCLVINEFCMYHFEQNKRISEIRNDDTIVLLDQVQYIFPEIKYQEIWKQVMREE
tara:strand:- start:514 stop:840 length:327 start_codon:yes stop_codon:yes gene_type:complete